MSGKRSSSSQEPVQASAPPLQSTWPDKATRLRSLRVARTSSIAWPPNASAVDMPSSPMSPDRSEVRRVVEDAISRFGRVDVWINNVGQGITRHPSQLTDEDIDQVMQVNVKSALYHIQEVLPHFKSRNDGHIIRDSSMLGRIPFAVIRSAYCGAKHFLNALTITFRAEVQETHPGIQVSIVSPGVVRTDFGLNAIHGGPDSRSVPESQSAGEVAGVIAEVVAFRTPDVYTRAGAQGRIASYYAAIGVDPQA